MANTSADIRLVLLEGGPLRKVYEGLVATKVLDGRARSMARAASSGLRSLGVSAATSDPLLGLRRRSGGPGHVVLANTLASLAAAEVLSRGSGDRSRLVCHVHELDGVAARILPPETTASSRLLRRVDAFVATGEPVRAMLVDRWDIDPNRVVVVDGWVDEPAVTDPVAGRRMLGVESDRPVVLGIGAMHRRKGPERFADLMALVADHPEHPVGRWLGGAPGSAVWNEVVADLGRSGAAPMTDIVASVAEPLRCVAAADLVVSTAIEDPYPLSVLEAAVLGVPVVGYDSGGLGVILGAVGQADAAVPLGDLLGLARVVRALLDDSEERRRRGRAFQEWVFDGHLTRHRAPQWWQVVSG